MWSKCRQNKNIIPQHGTVLRNGVFVDFSFTIIPYDRQHFPGRPEPGDICTKSQQVTGSATRLAEVNALICLIPECNELFIADQTWSWVPA